MGLKRIYYWIELNCLHWKRTGWAFSHFPVCCTEAPQLQVLEWLAGSFKSSNLNLVIVSSSYLFSFASHEFNHGNVTSWHNMTSSHLSQFHRFHALCSAHFSPINISASREKSQILFLLQYFLSQSPVISLWGWNGNPHNSLFIQRLNFSRYELTVILRSYIVKRFNSNFEVS